MVKEGTSPVCIYTCTYITYICLSPPMTAAGVLFVMRVTGEDSQLE